MTSTSAIDPTVSATVRGVSGARRPIAVILACTWLVVILAAALAADLLPLPDPTVDVGKGVRTGPFQLWSEPFGTDALGRSILSRLVFGARSTLSTAVVAALIALLAGLVIGITAGYLGGITDGAVGLGIDAVLAFPGLVLLLALAATLQPGRSTIIIGLTIFALPSFTRLARANTLRHRSSEFVLAARGLGARSPWIVGRELLPNVIAPVLAYAGVVTSSLVLAEASISFLGLGIRSPTPSWGNMIAEGQPLLREVPYLVFEPIVVLFLTIVSLNLVSEHARSRSAA